MDKRSKEMYKLVSDKGYSLCDIRTALKHIEKKIPKFERKVRKYQKEGTVLGVDSQNEKYVVAGYDPQSRMVFLKDLERSYCPVLKMLPLSSFISKEVVPVYSTGV